MHLVEITITVFLHMGDHVFPNSHIVLINRVLYLVIYVRFSLKSFLKNIVLFQHHICKCIYVPDPINGPNDVESTDRLPSNVVLCHVTSS
jgi:hypothetical protein